LLNLVIKFAEDQYMYQLVLEMSARKVHVISEHPDKPTALDAYMKLVAANQNSPQTKNGKYTIRAKPLK